jgi:NAD-dependent DNA ligase
VTREQIEDWIVEFGGRKTGSVSGKTDYLVAGHKLDDGREVHTSGKYRMAKSKGIPILDEEGFEHFVR